MDHGALPVVLLLLGLPLLGLGRVVVQHVIRQRRDRPVFRVLENLAWPEAWNEHEFRNELCNQLLANLGVRLKREHPLNSGTKIDVWLVHRKTQWYITIKRRRFDNQERLKVQGEIEDVVRYADGVESARITVVALLALPHNLSARDLEPVQELRVHLRRKLGSVLTDRKVRHDFVFDVVAKRLVQTSPTENGACTQETPNDALA